MARAKLGKKPSRNRFFCWKQEGGKKFWVAQGSGYTTTLSRRRLLKAADAHDLATYHGTRCKIVRYNSKTGQLEGAHKRRRRRR
jgi:hypothetical protein